MLEKVQDGAAALLDVSGIPDIAIPYLAGQLSCCKIVHNHSKDREDHLVGIDGAKLAARDPLADGFHGAFVQGTMMRHHHPVQGPPGRHHLALNQSRIRGIAPASPIRATWAR